MTSHTRRKAAKWWRGVALIVAALGIIAMIESLVSGEQIMEPAKLSALRSMLPELVDEEWNEYLHSPDVLWYTDSEMPAAQQHAIGNGYSETTFLSPFYNVSGDSSDNHLGHGLRAGGSGIEFPWAVAPGGGHDTPGVLSYKGQLLLDMANFPVIVVRDELPGRGGTVIRGRVPKPMFHAAGRPKYENGNVVYRWLHPVDKTIYVEVITQRIGRYDEPFEVRFRMRRADHWEVQVFRPVADREDFAEKLANLPETPQRRAAIEYLMTERELPRDRLFNPLHRDKVSFNVGSEIYYLPMLDVEAVMSCLSLPFENVTGDFFAGEAAAPSNRTGQPNIVPHNWQGVFAGADQFSCNECHQHTNRHVTEFQRDRGWYQRIRGSDGIFTWHPIALQSIALRGGHIPVRFRQAFLASGRVRVLTASSGGTTYVPDGYTILDGVF